MTVVKGEGVTLSLSRIQNSPIFSIFRVFTVGIHRGSRAVPRTRHHTCWTSQSRSQKKATRCHHRSECFIAWQHKPLQVTVHFHCRTMKTIFFIVCMSLSQIYGIAENASNQKVVEEKNQFYLLRSLGRL